jgi:branched-chain amino acid transport system ATP-binding protein
MTLLTIRGLTAGYGEGEVLHGIDLDVSERRTTALLGANGAGKTTTLRAVTGMISRRGSIIFDGHDLAGLSSDRVSRLGIAHVPQGRGTFAGLSIRENLLVGALARRDRKGVAADIEHCDTLFPILGTRARSMAGTLSGGEQQMLALSRALMSRPKLLLLDEPSLGLAPGVTRQIFDLLLLLRDEWDISMLVVEQNANLALGLADDAVVLENGQVVLAGPARDIAGHEDVRRAYLGT